MVLETGRLGGENGVILKKQSFNSVSDVMHPWLGILQLWLSMQAIIFWHGTLNAKTTWNRADRGYWIKENEQGDDPASEYVVRSSFWTGRKECGRRDESTSGNMYHLSGFRHINQILLWLLLKALTKLRLPGNLANLETDLDQETICVCAPKFTDSPHPELLDH